MAHTALADVIEFEHSLLPVVRAMTARGLRVDDKLRRERIKALRAESDRLAAEVQGMVYEVWDWLRRPDLFLTEKSCRCCRNGSGKKVECWGCAGFAEKPSKKALRESGKTLAPCVACGGQGQSFDVELNLDSTPQVAEILYRALGLPVRLNDGKETTDEEALQSLAALDSSGFVVKVLRFRKLVTMSEIYERIEPALDGRVRTVFNIAGTYTGRFSSSGAFYVPNSTNLQNLTESEAARDPLYLVRECIVPDEGEVLMYADLAAAEARVVAALSEDEFLLEQWRRDPFWSPHRWTASKIFGIPESEITKEMPEYFLGKKSRHALNYGEGFKKFWRTVNVDTDVTGVAITLDQAKKIVRGYHTLHPNLDGVWWNNVEERLKRDGFIENCFGRRCNFYPRFDPQTEELDADTLRAAIAFEPQSTVADLTNRGLLMAFAKERGNGFRLLHQAHDAVLAAVDQHRVRHVARILRDSLERVIVVNGYELRIPAEVFVCPRNWAHKERVL